MSTRAKTELLVGEAATQTLRYVTEIDGRLEQVGLELEVREWDVKDSAARETAGRAELGDDYDWHVEHASAQCWIHPDLNAAGIAVYVPRRD